MSWQQVVFERLRDREWHVVGELFEVVETDIPLHRATRFAAREPTAAGQRRELLPYRARWLVFGMELRRIGVENERPCWREGYKWRDRIRLAYLPGRICTTCRGPVVKATWSATRHVVCLTCEKIQHSERRS